MLLLVFWRFCTFLDYITRSLIEENESEFSAIWSKRIRHCGCAEIFVNKNFPGDYFFNKTKIISPCLDISSLISGAKRIFFYNRLDCFFHILDDPLYRDTYNILELQHFYYIDSMLVFSVNLEEQPPEHNKADYDPNVFQVIATEPSLIHIWVDLYCKSFEIENWKQPILDLIMSRYLNFDLIILKVKSNSAIVPAACALLYYYKRAMGLYCLGTLPEFRRRGIAMQIVRSSIDRARTKGMKLFFVQTFLNDGFSNIYNKAGLCLKYRKRIYANAHI
jgi:hypothetical protein